MESTEIKPKLSKFDADNPYAFWYILSIPAGIYLVFFIISFVFWKNNDNAGTFGDTFGFVNALFGGLTLGGIYYTIQLQRKELKETRDEFKTQSAIFQQQRFDEFFSNLLSIHREIRNDLNKYPLNGASVNIQLGRMIELKLVETYSNEANIVALQTELKGIPDIFQSMFDTYFNSLLNILTQIRDKGELYKFPYNDYTFTIISIMDKEEMKSVLLYSIQHNEHVKKTFRMLGFFNEKLIEKYFDYPKSQNLFKTL